MNIMNSPIVSSEWLNQHLNDKNLVILDASPKSNVSGFTSEFENIQIPNARYFDLKKDFSDSNAEFPNTIPSAKQFETNAQNLGINQDSIIVIYDNLGVYSSPRAWWLFKTFGHEIVFVLDGGLPEWAKNNFPTEEKISDESHKKGNFEANFESKNVRYYNNIKENITNKKELLIDARSTGRFNKTAPEPRKELQSGCILNSTNLPFQDLLENGKYKPKDELIKLFINLNLEDKPIIFSCGSGLTACIVALAYETAFNKPFSIYDGSWTEWATKEKLFT